MSLGDSLLKYFSEKEIEDSRSGAQYPNKEFILYYFKGFIFWPIKVPTTMRGLRRKNFFVTVNGSLFLFKRIPGMPTGMVKVAWFMPLRNG